MTYELLQQLDAAGFPISAYSQPGRKTEYKEPTLSELIAACGERFVCLRRGNSGWWLADAFEQGQTHFTFDKEGSTPEEAVANLYLALHTNKTNA